MHLATAHRRNRPIRNVREQTLAPKFGTSGLRGLVVELTPDLISDHVRAFLAAFPDIRTLYVGHDLRPSSPVIAATVTGAALEVGADVVDCGPLPTPALALAALDTGGGAIMVTGSHIPADRNGLKFYTPAGEISKADERDILDHLGEGPAVTRPPGQSKTDPDAGDRFIDRYRQAFGSTALDGMRIGLYAHSSVGRDLLAETLRSLGADVIELARSERFVPVDTEAVDDETRARILAWTRAHRLDATVSTDGDADRPMLADETGAIIPGDILGQITSAAMGAEVIVTPVSSNSGAEGRFARVLRTKIGSPHVIAGMNEAGGKVAGYEANGGYLLGFAARGPEGEIAPLWTRDCFLPLIAPLSRARHTPLSQIVAAEPGGITRASRLTETPTHLSAALTYRLENDPAAQQDFLTALQGKLAATDLTDGVRMTLESGEVVHIRPSGNAPELRLYVEARTADRAEALLHKGLAVLRERIDAIGAETGAP
jgi:phosphomannomutase